MPDMSLIEASVYDSVGVTPGSTSTGVTVTGTTANTKGAWAQIVAATTYDANEIIVFFAPGSAATPYLVDIGIGGAGSEVVLIPNLYSSSNGVQPKIARFLVNIPAGTRIVARCQTTITGTRQIVVSCLLIAGTLMSGAPLGNVAAYGITPGSTAATSLDAGGTAHTKGAWVELTAATVGQIRGLQVLFDSNDNITVSPAFLVDIGIGAAGSEVVIIPNIPLLNGSTIDHVMPGSWWFSTSIADATRVAARIQSSTTDATARVIEIAAYGVS